MPCYSIQSFTVALKAANLELLIAAIKAEFGLEVRERYGLIQFGADLGNGLGWGTVSIRDGEVTLQSNNDLSKRDTVAFAHRIQRAYAAQAVQVASLRFGWLARQTATSATTKKLVLTKRT